MCPAYMKFDKPGREFPGSGRGGAKFGVIISSGGGYTEPARILALKMARITFAPAFRYIGPRGVIGHFQEVRPDRSARPVENDVWPVRGDNVARDKDPSPRFEGVGSGDSYVIDPSGETGARSRRHREDWIFTDVDPAASDESWGRRPVALERPRVRQTPAGGCRTAQVTTAARRYPWTPNRLTPPSTGERSSGLAGPSSPGSGAPARTSRHYPPA
jgi:predicted amidohydrolase